MTDFEQRGALNKSPQWTKKKNLPLWFFEPWEPASSTLEATSNSVIQKIASIVVAQSRTGFAFTVALSVFKCVGP